MAPPQTNKIILCTGANQGLGFSIIQVAGLREPSTAFILACRNYDAGQDAVRKLKELGVKAQLHVVLLDVTNDKQIGDAVEEVEHKYGKLDVLINNAGIFKQPPQEDLSVIRETYNEMLNVNLTSVAVLTTAFMPLLYKSSDPKVINISSGLGSVQNTLTRKMNRSPSYGSSKIGLNGLSVHLQVGENDRIVAEKEKGESNGKPRIRFYVCAPGVLKTAFTRYFPHGKPPEAGAEVVVQLLADEKGTYEGGTYWEFEENEMRQVPW